MSTPTPRTDAAWASSFEECEYRAAHTARTMRECSQQLETELAALAAECDQLRADRTYNHECINRLATATGTLGEKSEKVVEVALSTIAELRAERARLDYLSTLGFEHRHHETGDHLGHEWTISSYGESEDVTLRDVIDAEMREDEK